MPKLRRELTGIGSPCSYLSAMSEQLETVDEIVQVAHDEVASVQEAIEELTDRLHSLLDLICCKAKNKSP